MMCVYCMYCVYCVYCVCCMYCMYCVYYLLKYFTKNKLKSLSSSLKTFFYEN